MSTINTGVYNPPPPNPGLTVINLLSAEKKPGGTHISYDIGTGPSAGYGFTRYQQTGIWPLVWCISDSIKAEIVYKHAMDAVQDKDSSIKTLEEIQNVPIWAKLDYDEKGNIKVCRSYSWDRFPISSDSIRVGSSSWAKGSSDYVRASLIAKNSGLPVLLADVHEKDSPMVNWCAEHGMRFNRCCFLSATTLHRCSTLWWIARRICWNFTKIS